MRSVIVGALAVLAGSCVFGFEVELQREDGSRIDPAKAGVELSLKRRTDPNGVETLACRAVSLAEGVRKLRIVAKERFAGATTVWNGRDEKRPPKGRGENPLYLDSTFLMGAAWKPGSGVALGTGAEDFNSDADLVFDGDEIAVSVHAAFLRKGAVYACTFHRIAFDPKYGIRDALARYYPLYPRRFLRNPDVTPGVYGICAEYGSWRNGDPEACRFMNASWEWCHGAGRTWGDMLGREMPSGKLNADYSWVEKFQYSLRDGRYRTVYNSKMSREEFDRMRDDRLACGYFCGVANGFYTMSVANISNRIASRHPDSVATENPLAPNDYFYSTEVFAFPECSWGAEVRRQIADVVKTCDLGAMAFDVSRPRSVYRGERLREMANVSWDRFGPGVVRGVASARLFDYIRTLPNKRLPGKTAVAVNTKYQHLSDLLYIDMTMFESTPWDHDPPFPLAGRYALGEKGLTLWEGYSPREFDPNFNRWTDDEKTRLINDLSRYAVHRSLATGASLPAGYACEYAALVSHAFVRLNAAGWKPVPGFAAEGTGWELARYGAGERSWLVACNETNAARTAELTVFPSEVASGIVGAAPVGKAFVYAPFFGGSAKNAIDPARQAVSCEIGPLLVGVLECVATAEGRGTVRASWSREGDDAVLTLASADFTGSLLPRASFEGYARDGAGTVRLAPGRSATVRYRDPAVAGWCAKIAALDLKDLAKVRVGSAADSDSKDMADRVAAFFKGVTRPADGKKAKRHASPVKTAVDPNLKARTVRLGDIVLQADDRVAFSDLVRRFLNVLNRERYPKYGPPYPMDKAVRKGLGLIRY